MMPEIDILFGADYRQQLCAVINYDTQSFTPKVQQLPMGIRDALYKHAVFSRHSHLALLISMCMNMRS